MREDSHKIFNHSVKEKTRRKNHDFPGTCKIVLVVFHFFPRASERRVLPIVGVCQTFSHRHIFSSSHPHIFTSSHLHILTSSHLVIFTSAHLLLFTSSHLYILSCPLALSFLSISLLRRGAVTTRRHETQPFRTKRGSIAQNCGKIAISSRPAQPFRTK